MSFMLLRQSLPSRMPPLPVLPVQTEAKLWTMENVGQWGAIWKPSDIGHALGGDHPLLPVMTKEIDLSNLGASELEAVELGMLKAPERLYWSPVNELDVLHILDAIRIYQGALCVTPYTRILAACVKFWHFSLIRAYVPHAGIRWLHPATCGSATCECTLNCGSTSAIDDR
eukprot:GHVU01100307.1.p1 GENE.GHVU01100307.1~~GHVU01100307.1.p1  ORF type:complete len:171 (+),score=4.28 GHVU01100307.1:106-618(+)